jgi:hypothetical protein
MSTATPFEQDPVQLRQRAQECWHDADLSSDPITRDTLLALARAFEQLAMLAEAKGSAPDRHHQDASIGSRARGAGRANEASDRSTPTQGR